MQQEARGGEGAEGQVSSVLHRQSGRTLPGCRQTVSTCQVKGGIQLGRSSANLRGAGQDVAGMSGKCLKYLMSVW